MKTITICLYLPAICWLTLAWSSVTVDGRRIRYSDEQPFHISNYGDSQPLTCGIVRNTAVRRRSSRIFSGRTARPGEFPHQVMLDIGCSGSIIDEWHILTAARCVSKCNRTITQSIYALVGQHVVPRHFDDVWKAIKVENYVTHKDFDPCKKHNTDNDIALLKVKKRMPLRLTPSGLGSINSICLPPDHNNSINISSGYGVLVSGWGLDRISEGTPPIELQVSELRVEDFDKCAEYWAGSPDRYRRLRRDKHFCLISDSVHRNDKTCGADPGGPVAQLVDGKYEIMGIAMNGDENCAPDAPSIYTRVQGYLGWIELAKSRLNEPVGPKSCGIARNYIKRPSNRIIGGRSAKPGEFPHQVFLLALVDGSNKTQACGGSIIDEWHILTAAHCVISCNGTVNEIYAYIGQRVFPAPDVPSNIIKIENHVAHKKFNMPCGGGHDVTDNDIALLKASERIQFKLTPDGYGSVNSVGMPSANKDLPLGSRVFVSGWGLIIYPKTPPADLQVAEMRVSSFNECAEYWKNYQNMQLKPDIHLCLNSDSNRTNACYGDSGGPVTQLVDGKYEIVGIVSDGHKQCDPSVPSIYTRVQGFLDWIESAKKKLANHMIDPPLSCGVALEQPKRKWSERIIKGRDARPGEFPHQVMIRANLKNSYGAISFCGGSIIDEWHILTAAHCIAPARTEIESIVAYVGKHTFDIWEDATNYTRHEVANYVAHEDWAWDSKTKDDIGLIKVKERMKFALKPAGFGSVNSICLPNKTHNEVPANSRVIISGWGSSDSDSTEHAAVLQSAEMRVEDFYKCAYYKMKLLDDILDEAKDICLISDDRKTNVCKGDSGGPAARLVDGTFQLVGIASRVGIKETSGGFGCDPYQAAVFTRVDNYLDWIETAKKKLAMPDPKLPLSCGVALEAQRRWRSKPRIMRGRGAKAGEFPYQVMLRIKGSGVCGGSIIDEWHVLTAAHCIAPEYDLYMGPMTRVFVGKHSLDMREDMSSWTVHDVDHYVIHEGYYVNGTTSPTALDDIALIRVTNRMKFELKPDGFGSANSICMPPPAAPNKNDGTNSRLIISGWGDIRSEPEEGPKVLQAAEMRVEDFDKCAEHMLKKTNNKMKLDRSKHMCLISDNHETNACFGDSGGPAARRVDGKFEIIGVASSVRGRRTPDGQVCFASEPSVYMRVQHYSDWIEAAKKDLASRAGSPLSCGTNSLELKPSSRKWSARIIKGRGARPGEFPHQVRLVIKMKGKTIDCGGSIIDDWHILTAAHCIDGADSIAAYAGQYSENLNSDLNWRGVPEIASHIVHEEWTSRMVSLSGDIALLKVKARMKFALKPAGSGSLNSICMPQKTDKLPVDTRVIITGWGDIQSGPVDKPEVLQVADMRVEDFDKCAEAYKLTYGQAVLDPSKHICLISDNRDTNACRGDSGSPAARLIDGKLQLIGINSRVLGKRLADGKTVCLPEEPSVYTRVQHYLDWIEWAKKELIVTEKPPLPCGAVATMKPQSQSRILSERTLKGRDARPGEFPYQAMVITEYYRKGYKAYLDCGGVIINEWLILTAATCIAPKDKRVLKHEIYVGKHLSDPNEPVRNWTMYEVAAYTAHEDYVNNDSTDNIALMMIYPPAEGMKFELKPEGYGSVNSICLPNKRDVVPIGSQVTISGWGNISATDGPEVLQAATMRTIDFDECAKYYKEFPFDPRKHICLMSDNHDAMDCFGDTGGPAALRVAGRLELVGLSGYINTKQAPGGPILCDPTKPSIFMRVQHYLDWIEYTKRDMLSAMTNKRPLSCGMAVLDDSRRRHQNHRVIGGRDAYPGELPYQVFLEISVLTSSGQQSRTCGGSIIDEWHILTAAHCVEDTDSTLRGIFVHRGQHHTKEKANGGEKDHSNWRRIEMDDYLIHPDHDSDVTNGADIAVIKVKERMKFALEPHGYGSVNSICMPPADDDDLVRPGRPMIVSGWGKTQFSPAMWPAVLQAAAMRIHEPNECAASLKEHDIPFHPAKQFCLTSTNFKTTGCESDAGGPAARFASGKYQIIGVASFTAPNCTLPSVYTRVQYYLDWIEGAKKELADNGDDDGDDDDD